VISTILALCNGYRDGRDKPGHDAFVHEKRTAGLRISAGKLLARGTTTCHVVQMA
jgi:hypothetical protein